MDQVCEICYFVNNVFYLFMCNSCDSCYDDVCECDSMRKLRRLVKEPMVSFIRLVTF
jgi:hypothetical protein